MCVLRLQCAGVCAYRRIVMQCWCLGRSALFGGMLGVLG